MNIEAFLESGLLAGFITIMLALLLPSERVDDNDDRYDF